MTDRLPVTVLSGFLGAKKTTLLNHGLNKRDGRRLAVIVNDRSDVNIDAEVIQIGGARLLRTEEGVVEARNGYAKQLGLVRKVVRAVNPDANIIKAKFGQTPLDGVLDAKRSDFEKANQNPLCARERYGFAKHIPEAEEYGVSSFTYQARAPFHPARFYAFIGSAWKGVVRAKGLFWLATRPAYAGELSQAGPVIRTSPCGLWWAVIPERDWPENPQDRALLQKLWHQAYGDRRQQIVFIGIDMDKQDLRMRLDDCLVGSDADEQADFHALSRLPDPFATWPANIRRSA